MTTRLYLPGAPAAVSPAFDAAWDVTAGADRAALATSKSLVYPVAARTSGAETSTSVVNLLNRQYVSLPLDGAQTITGTGKGVLRAGESSTSADMRAQTVVRVVSNDGSTVRGTLWAADTSALSSEFPTTGSAVTRQFPLAALTPWTLTSVAAQDGDRVVIEFGVRAHNTVSTSFTHNLYFGDNNAGSLTELTGAEAQNSNNVPWFEFSQTLTFRAEAVAPTFDGWGIPV